MQTTSHSTMDISGKKQTHANCHHHHHDNNESSDPFAHHSQEYDTLEHEARARTIATAMIEKIELHRNMHIMDFGCGTGLLTKFVAPHVGSILAVDPSAAMLEQFKSKSFDCATVTTLHGDVIQDDSILPQQEPRLFDGVLSSMVLHHVLDLEKLFAKLATWIVPGGFLAFSDLDRNSENGMFHDPEHQSGVHHHHGLDRVELARIAGQQGFVDIIFSTVDSIHKTTGDFPVFLMTARRMKAD